MQSSHASSLAHELFVPEVFAQDNLPEHLTRSELHRSISHLGDLERLQCFLDKVCAWLGLGLGFASSTRCAWLGLGLASWTRCVPGAGLGLGFASSTRRLPVWARGAITTECRSRAVHAYLRCRAAVRRSTTVRAPYRVRTGAPPPRTHRGTTTVACGRQRLHRRRGGIRECGQLLQCARGPRGSRVRVRVRLGVGATLTLTLIRTLI